MENALPSSSFSIFNSPIPSTVRPYRTNEKVPPCLSERRHDSGRSLIQLAFDIVINLPAAHTGRYTPRRFSGISAPQHRHGSVSVFPASSQGRSRLVLPGTASGLKMQVGFFLVLPCSCRRKTPPAEKAYSSLFNFDQRGHQSRPNTSVRDTRVLDPLNKAIGHEGNSRYASLHSSLAA